MLGAVIILYIGFAISAASKPYYIMGTLPEM